MKEDDSIRQAVTKNGREFLLYYCEAMAHRLLKTPVEKRSIRVGDFIKKSEELAAQFIPGQDYQPMKISRIRIAKYLDQWGLTRKLFQRYRKI